MKASRTKVKENSESPSKIAYRYTECAITYPCTIASLEHNETICYK